MFYTNIFQRYEGEMVNISAKTTTETKTSCDPTLSVLISDDVISRGLILKHEMRVKYRP